MDQQTDQPTISEPERLARELSEYVNSLDGPTLLADLRCLSSTMIEAFANRDGGMSGSAITAVVFAQALSRLDTSPTDHDPESSVVPLPEGFPAAEHCDCHDEGGGLKGRLRAVIDAARAEHAAHHDEEARIRAMVTERLKDVPGFAGVMVVDASQAALNVEGNTTDGEAPRPGMYL